MTTFTKRSGFGITKIFNEADEVTVSFSNTEDGRRLYEILKSALGSATRDSLIDGDTGEYLVGSLEQLARRKY